MKLLEVKVTIDEDDGEIEYHVEGKNLSRVERLGILVDILAAMILDQQVESEELN
jgi:uncharacterized protein YxjI